MTSKVVRVLQGDSNIMSEVNALRWLVHLVGDVHQPIHVGCGFIDRSGQVAQLVTDPRRIREENFRHDQGGNRLVLPVSGSVSLHSYWDSRLAGQISELEPNPAGSPAEAEEFTAGEFAEEDEASPELKSRFVEKLSAIVARERRARRQGALPAPANVTPPDRLAEEWANHSLTLARSAYESLRIVRNLSGGKYKVAWEGKAAYDGRCAPIVLQQMSSAAENLAALLDAIWG